MKQAKRKERKTKEFLFSFIACFCKKQGITSKAVLWESKEQLALKGQRILLDFADRTAAR